MQLGLVIPAWGRYAVTHLALAQHAHLAGQLAPRGITVRSVVIANDENLDIAREFGCETLEQENVLGRKVNDGIEHACREGADYVAFVGSDDWIHPDLFEPLFSLPDRPAPVISGHVVSVVDLERGRLRKLGCRGPHGVSPWLIPRWALEPCAFRPIRDDLECGMEGSLQRALGSKPDWIFHDPHEFCRVDFKTDLNMTPYTRITRLLGYGPELDAWDALAEWYPAELIALGRETQLRLIFDGAGWPTDWRAIFSGNVQVTA